MNWPDDFIDKIICGDCLDVMKEMPGGRVDIIVTDPPYGVSHKKSGEEYMIGDTTNLIPYFLPHAHRILKPEGAIYMFSSTTKLVDTLPVFNIYFKLHSLIIWDKRIGRIPRQLSHYKLRYEPVLYGSKGLHKLNNYRDDIFQCDIPRGKKRFHPTQKPKEIIKYFIENSTNENGIIFDPFLGSGTTAIACKELGRHFIGIEINPDYCKIAEERLVQGVLP